MSTMPLKSLLILLTLAWTVAPWLAAEDIRFPEGSGVINVQQVYGAKGDGVTDDTAALQRAIADPDNGFKVLYFPNGTYLVSDKLSQGGDKRKAKALTLQGQSMAKTVIRLQDRAAGYEDASKPKPLFSSFEGGSTGEAFHNQVFNLTFDIGAGKPGAIGAQFMANNQGAMIDVTIRTSDPQGAGAIGLDCSKHESGPCLYRRVSITGFDIGIMGQPWAFSLVYEDIALKNQRKTGILNEHSTMSFHRLVSDNSVPVLTATGDGGVITLVDSDFRGGAPGSTAITGPNKIILRKVKATGYASIVAGIAGTHVDFATTAKTWTFSGAGTPEPLDLKIEDAPEIPWDEPATWVLVKPGANGIATSDDVQRAIDEAAASKATTVCFPSFREKPGKEPICRLSKTITVHGSVRRIIGLESNLYITDPLLNSKDPIFRVEKLDAPALLIERFWQTPWKKGQFCFVEDRSDRTIILRHLMLNGPFEADLYRKAGGKANKVFIDDVVAHGCYFTKGQQAWFRQYNPESNLPMTINDGASVWVLGLKIEGFGTCIDTRNGGKTEVYGGFLMGSWVNKPDMEAREKYPAYSFESGGQGFIVTTADRKKFKTLIRETRNGKTREIPGDEVDRYLGGYGSISKP
jgi:hypothetical protein